MPLIDKVNLELYKDIRPVGFVCWSNSVTAEIIDPLEKIFGKESLLGKGHISLAIFILNSCLTRSEKILNTAQRVLLEQGNRSLPHVTFPGCRVFSISYTCDLPRICFIETTVLALEQEGQTFSLDFCTAFLHGLPCWVFIHLPTWVAGEQRC